MPEERKTLLRVAALTARGAPEGQVFAEVTDAVARFTAADQVAIFRFEDDLMRLLDVWTHADDVRQPIDERRPMGAAMRSMRDDPRPMHLHPVPQDAAFRDTGEAMGITAVVAVPITVEGVVWGAVFACYRSNERIGPDVPERIGEFIELIAIALVNAERRTYLQRLIDEQEALRLIGALVARDAPLDDVLGAIVGHAQRLLDVDVAVVIRFREEYGEVLAVHGEAGGLMTGTRRRMAGDGSVGRVMRTGRSARVESLPAASASGGWAEVGAGMGMSSSASAPVLIDGRVWGALSVGITQGSMSPQVEERLAGFAELAGSAIAGAMARDELRVVAEEQGALRRVAELVARGAGQDELFKVVAAEAYNLIDRTGITLMRQDAHGFFLVVADHEGPVPVGTPVTITDDDQGIVAQVSRTGRAVRQDNYERLSGRAWARDDWGVGSGVGVPITVGGRVWGVLGATTQVNVRLPGSVEERLDQFAKLIAAALANAQARDALQQAATEQSALRRVAELVARAVEPAEVFAAVTREASALIEGRPATLLRFEPGRAFVVLATQDGPVPDGGRIEYPAGSVADRVRSSGVLERIDDYRTEPDAHLAEELGTRAAVQVPVFVGGATWGMLSATSPDAPLPPGTEDRLVQFADLVGAAIADADSRAELRASRARLAATADDTRRRVQRDLHDGAQQRLVQSMISLKLARHALAEDDRALLTEQLGEALEQSERALNDLRDLVRGILPGSLTVGGLAAGVEALIQDLPVRVDANLDLPRLDVGVETTAYFVVAEALTNVVKHAAATRVAVLARAEDHHLVVEVHDDGRGGAGTTEGSGLTGLRDRVHALDGRLEIESPVGGGTTVRATLPLAGDA